MTDTPVRDSVSAVHIAANASEHGAGQDGNVREIVMDNINVEVIKKLTQK